MTDMLETAYKNLKYLREKAGLTQGDLAEKTGIAQSSISRMEKGEFKESSDDTLKPFAEFFGVSIAKFKYDDLTLAVTLANELPKPPPKPVAPKPEQPKPAPVLAPVAIHSPQPSGFEDSKLSHIIESFPRLTEKQRRKIIDDIDTMVNDNAEAYDIFRRLNNPK